MECDEAQQDDTYDFEKWMRSVRADGRVLISTARNKSTPNELLHLRSLPIQNTNALEDFEKDEDDVGKMSHSSLFLKLKTPFQRVYRSPEIFLRPVQQGHAEGPDYFCSLSDELILEIFKYLPKTTLVKCGLSCRRFRKLSIDETLWKRLNLGKKSISVELLHRLIGRGVQYLRLSQAHIGGKYSPSQPPMEPLRLRYLDLSMTNDTDTMVIAELIFRCKDLVAVSLEGCQLNDRVCVALSRNVNLSILNMSTCSGLSTHGIRAIVDGCRQLTEWNLAFTGLCAVAVRYICNKAPATLTRFNLAGCRRSKTFLDIDIAALCNSCPDLIELDISDSADITQLSIQVISESLLKLRVLSCSRCYCIEPNAYAMVPPWLNEVNIFNSIQEESIPHLKRLLPPTTALNVGVFSTVARPTVGIRRTAIWGNSVRDE